jgi:hypothetical protein
MASTSVLKLVIDDKEYNASLKEARTGMQHLENALNSANKTFNQVDKSVVNYVRGIGQMEAQSKTAKGRIGEMTSAFVELSMQYNKMSDEVKNGDVGKALSESMQTLKQRTIEAKQELAELNSQLDTSKSGISGGGGGLFSGLGDKMSGMLQVFGGNLMTKAAGWVASFASEMGDAVKQGIELARSGEGIRNAFERLGRGDLLDGLREATHGTVTDLELMKAAVKFNDFKLPVEELGTMLAFAQQKAKDTGQSVDYMVDSIVTGLGRKSLMILDNLGLSANDIKEKMKDTGDMTKAVGAIIREQMAKSGDYIETAADRATKADVELKNAMEDLGRTFQPLADEANSAWNSIKVGALNLLNSAIKPLIDSLTTAGRLRKELANMNGGGNGQPSFVDSQISALAGSNYKNYRFNAALGNYDKQIAGIQNELASRQTGSNVRSNGQYVGIHSQVLQDRLKALQTMRAEYVKRAKNILNPLKISEDVEKGIASGGGGGRTSRGGARSSVTTPKVDEILPVGSVAALNKELSELRKQQDLATTTEGWEAQQQKIDELTYKIKVLKGEMPDPTKIQQGKGQSVLGIGIGQAELDSVQKQLNAMVPDGGVKIPAKIEINTQPLEDITKKGKDVNKAFSAAAQAVSSIGDAFNAIEDPSAKAAGMVMQAIASIALGFATASTNANTAGTGWGWLAWLAAGAAAMATTISTIHSLTNLSEGGFVPGNSYSGDNIPGNGGTVGLNSGELVLNRSQQNNLANALQGGPQGLNLRAVVSGEQIVLVANRSLKRRGKGELVTWK